MWGSSTRALEDARDDAISKTYQCSFDDCFDAVLSLARHLSVGVSGREDAYANADEKTVSGSDHKFFEVFIKDRDRQHIVVMGIGGSVDTTEAGIFFSQTSPTTIKLEVTSLSTNAKRRVAQIVFDALDSRFSEGH